MAHRAKMSRKSSRKLFRATAAKVHPANINAGLSRGGIML